jgi:hypothetical protein
MLFPALADLIKAFHSSEIKRLNIYVVFIQGLKFTELFQFKTTVFVFLQSNIMT